MSLRARRQLPAPVVTQPPPAARDWVNGSVQRRSYGPTKLMVYLCGGHGARLAWAMVRGAQARLAELAEPIPDDAGWEVWVWGLLRGTLDKIAQAEARGLRWWYADHSYLLRGHERANYRVVARGWQLDRVLDVPSDRWRRLERAGVTVEPWRSGGRHVLVCPPTPPVLAATGRPQWLEETLLDLARHTDRPIRVRHKTAAWQTPLGRDLADAHCLVTLHSMAAVEAVLAGVPVVVAPSSAAAPVGLTDLSKVETPLRPDRERWLHSLAYGQFHHDELANGTAWRILKETQGRGTP